MFETDGKRDTSVNFTSQLKIAGHYKNLTNEEAKFSLFFNPHLQIIMKPSTSYYRFNQTIDFSQQLVSTFVFNAVN